MTDGSSATAWLVGGPRVVKRLLDVGWYLLLAFSVVAPALLVVGLLHPDRVRVSIPAFVDLDPSAYMISSKSAGQEAVVHGLAGDVSLAGSRAGLIVTAAVIFMGLGLALLVVFQLRALLAGVVGGRPFAVDSARRVRLIGIAVLAAELLRAVVLFAASWWARDHLRARGVSFREVFPLRIEVLLLGVLLVLLGEVFGVGARLQHDHDLTI